MATSSLPAHINPKELVPTAPGVFRWSREKYQQLIASGYLDENDSIELLFGQIVPKIPIGELHAHCLTLLVDFFYARFGTRYMYRPQNPITILDDSEPEPDLAIVTRKNYAAEGRHPGEGDILLLIEIADTTLAYDRGDKARAYALAGIAEYWVVNLPNRQVEVYTAPIVATGEFGERTVFPAAGALESPLCGTVEISAFLPV